MDEGALEILTELCVEIYENFTKDWAQDFTKVVTIPTPKKGNTVDCADYGNPILISYASKKLLKILSKHFEAKTDIFY